MDAQRWEGIENLFHEASAQPKANRHAFLVAACAGDTETLEEVLSLLAENDSDDSLLDRDVGDVARSVIGDFSISPGTRSIGPYSVLKVLGHGGMGVVYLAERADLDHQVALKTLLNAWMSPARRDRFQLEARILSRLNHPSIARLYDAGLLEDGAPWFAMEYVDGVPITEYCDLREPSIDGRLRIFRAVCEAVLCAHQQAILHRDLKPSNIFVKKGGEVRLLDFGIAKQLDELEDSTDPTRTGLRLATPAYASPEQLRGERATLQSDVYSLGVILYELLTGRRPFEIAGGGAQEAEPARPSVTARTKFALEGRAWSDLDLLILTAIHTDKRRRYQSVDAFVRDIDHFLGREPLEARPNDFGYKFGRFVSRNRKALLAACAAFVVALGMAAYFVVRLREARDTALGEAARAQRIQAFMLHVFEGGDANAGPQEDLRVLTLIDRSAREARALNADPTAQADLFQTLGNVYQNIGKPDRAEEFFLAALNKREGNPDENGARIVESLAALGMLRTEQSRLDEAESLVRRGLERARKTLPPGHSATVASMSALGRVLLDRGKHDQAIQTLETAMSLQAPSALPTQDSATIVSRLAMAHHYAGRYDEAESLNRRLVDIYRTMYGEGHPESASSFINLGAIKHQRGEYREAENYYRDAAAIFGRHYGDSHPSFYDALQGAAQALVFQNRLDEAEPILEKVLAGREKIYGPVHSGIATTLGSLGRVALQRKKFEEAEKHFRRMGGIYRATKGERHYFNGIALSNLASVYLEKKDYGRAERLLVETLAIQRESLAPDHFDIGVARVKLGRVLLGQRRFREAEEQSLGGLRVLERKTGASSPWIAAAREDLAALSKFQAVGHQPQNRALPE
ncbi:MAG: tetratricopeptide repeat protein [Bryobacteraceae bacterium]